MASNILTHMPALETWECVGCAMTAPGVTVRNAAAISKLTWKAVENATGKTKQELGGVPGQAIMRKCVSCGAPLCSACIAEKIKNNWWSGVDKSSCHSCGGKYGKGQELVHFGVLGDFRAGLSADGALKGQTIDFSPKKALKNSMINDLVGGGIGLVGIGILSFIFSNFLNSYWGVASIVLGIFTIFVKNKAMFIVLGIYLIIIGLWNIGVGHGSPWWIFGYLQIYWGGVEIRKFRKYSII